MLCCSDEAPIKVILCILFLFWISGCSDDTCPAADAGVDTGGADGAAPDVDRSCATPRPFMPPKKPAGWTHTSTKLLVVTQGPPNHRAQDVIAAESADQVLIGKFTYGPLDKELKDEQVEIYMQKRPPCGPWILIGKAMTSKDGQHGTRHGIADDGGRVFFTVPKAHARPAGRYPVRMLVRGDNSMAAHTLFVVKPGTDAVVFDIDSTLTIDDYKADFLNLTASAAKVSLRAAYGNGSTDIEAYAKAKVPKNRTYIIGKHGGEGGTMKVTSYPLHLPTAKGMPLATVKAPPATFGW